MSATAPVRDPVAAPWRSAPVLLAALTGLMMLATWEALAWMATDDWSTEEYSHCWLIPPIALFILATRARDLAAVPWTRSWSGVTLALAGLLMTLLGNLSAVYTITQYGFIVTLWGVILAMIGPRAVRIIWPALVYLVFMVPLPDFLQVQLTAQLQLVSSILGVAVIRLAGLAVYLEGNVIDLGNYRLAVAEACSGLRYLFPLMSFGFLCAAIFVAPRWQRVVVFLSTIPITVLMNSVRIGVIGILVNFWGTEMAEGFIHFFEGWVVFMLCVSILFAEMWLMTRLSRQPFLKSLRMDTPPVKEMTAAFGNRAVNSSLAAAAVVVVSGTLAGFAIDRREELVPVTPALVTFPLVIGAWEGREQLVDPTQLETLKTDGALLANYTNRADGSGVSLWIAYYASQRSGRSVHSPKTCLPGGGWEIDTLERVEVDDVRADQQALPVNRAVIALGEQQQLVYYWFVQRGRLVTNEYLVKWYIFWDSLTRNRSDGALVRLVTYVDPALGGMAGADERLRQFARDLDPKLDYFLPQASAVLAEAGTP